jgi:3-deoxy-manno-octulosonate cytidylyltransferase (CMP-KDO synthetase)
LPFENKITLIQGVPIVIKKQAQKVVGVIPARYASTRFPGKPLANIMGKTLIQRTYENALRCSHLDALVVATDDRRIYDHVVEFGGTVVMTPECPTGTDRIAYVVAHESHLQQAEIVVNVQGDEPCLDPNVTQRIIEVLQKDPDAAMSTAVVVLDSDEEAANPGDVKCVLDLNGNVLYFSRALIPGGFSLDFRKNHTVYYKHLGIYAYRREFLLKYPHLPPTPLQLAENLEQLKVLEHGYKIKTAVVDSVSIGVNTPEEIKKVEQVLCKQNSFLSQAESVRP